MVHKWKNRSYLEKRVTVRSNGLPLENLLQLENFVTEKMYYRRKMAESHLEKWVSVLKMHHRKKNGRQLEKNG